jgi:hypothetical protein
MYGFYYTTKNTRKNQWANKYKKRKIVFLKNCVVFFFKITLPEKKKKKKRLSNTGIWGIFGQKNTPNNLATLY